MLTRGAAASVVQPIPIEDACRPPYYQFKGVMP
jgi:hypothetical protein